MHAARGFKIGAVIMDGAFNSAKTAPADERMLRSGAAEVECVDFLESGAESAVESARMIHSRLPFAQMLKRLIIGLVLCVVFWISAFPPKSGVGPFVSPWKPLCGLSP